MVVRPLVLNLCDFSIVRSLDFLPDGAVGLLAHVVAAGILAALDLLLAVFAPVEVVLRGWFGGKESQDLFIGGKRRLRDEGKDSGRGRLWSLRDKNREAKMIRNGDTDSQKEEDIMVRGE